MKTFLELVLFWGLFNLAFVFALMTLAEWRDR